MLGFIAEQIGLQGQVLAGIGQLLSGGGQAKRVVFIMRRRGQAKRQLRGNTLQGGTACGIAAGQQVDQREADHRQQNEKQGANSV